MLLTTSHIAKFGYIPKQLDKTKMIDAWVRMSKKYERKGGAIPLVRRVMLEGIREHEALDPLSVHLLKKNTTMANGLPGTVYTGVVHAPVIDRQVHVTTLAGNPQASRNPIYKGAINSLGEHLKQNHARHTRVHINAIPSTKQLYTQGLGYVHDDKYRNTVGKISDYIDAKKP